ncbi:MAG: hypothetical protein OXG13_09820 [Gemmatimonadaceae bacterium]|nr:hypothetical protein [Gemmatimonadaceae bacterium]
MKRNEKLVLLILSRVEESSASLVKVTEADGGFIDGYTDIEVQHHIDMCVDEGYLYGDPVVESGTGGLRRYFMVRLLPAGRDILEQERERQSQSVIWWNRMEPHVVKVVVGLVVLALAGFLGLR